MTTTIFDKTDKGREEIATRKYHLAARLRTLLVMVDGKQSTDALLKKVAGIGLNEGSLIALLANGYIQGRAVNPTAARVRPAAKSILPEGQTQYEAILHFYTKTIKSTIGLRGYRLQLKVEKAASIDDFRALRRPYLEAVFKVKGDEMARNMRRRLDRLLYPDESSRSNRSLSR